MDSATKVTDQLATDLSEEMISTYKLLVSLRSGAPRVHPAVEPASHPVLFLVLCSEEPPRVSELAARLHMDVSTVSRQASHLVKAGLLHKATCPQDGRAQVLSITDAGREAVATLQRHRGEFFARVLSGWGAQDIEEFRNYLARFREDAARERDAAG